MKYRWSLVNILVILVTVYLGINAWVQWDSCPRCVIAFAYFIPVGIGALLADFILQCLITKRKWLFLAEAVLIIVTVVINNMK